jgi:hypothetical protein
MPPVLDAIGLGREHDLEFCRRHTAALPQWVMCLTRYSSTETYRSSPFWGDFIQGR